MQGPTVVIEEILGRSRQGMTDCVPAGVSWDAISACLERCRRDDFWNLS